MRCGAGAATGASVDAGVTSDVDAGFDDAGNPVVVDASHLGLSPLIAPAVPSASVKDAAAPERPPIGQAPLRTLVEDYERRLILGAVEESGGNWARAATALGMHRSNLHALAKRLGLRGA